MTTRRDDDALSWDGDDDPTLDVGADTSRATIDEPVPDAAPAAVEQRPARAAAEPEPADLVEREPEQAAEPAAMGNAALVSIGLIAGAYIFFAIGWVIAGLRLQAVSGLLVDPVMYAAGTWGATLAGPIWFLTAFVLTRRSRTWVRFVALLVGLVLVVPWPFLQTGVGV
ncbi:MULTISPECIES: DNA polymerase III subunit gamma/tau [unclassified Microbacterium]|uniref:DNA polymerase III subunit gamma/tau n=1 Tax=unclassified Microbacterium TaxID=2609290 RepID=UPI000D56F1E4|nr:DNA polymerase III subunit gamma/tau [Microbacterium sp. Gd 4-13]PVW06369.1 DNA polymerase III subunit gamma/tau [Microbacterium sp. Gd 4-13]